MTKHFLCLIAGLTILTAGCAPRRSAQSTRLPQTPDPTTLGADKVFRSRTARAPLPDVPDHPDGDTQSSDRKMIYTGSYVLGVYETQPVMDKLELLARNLDGYVQNQTLDTIVLRIPADKFDQAGNTIESLGQVIEKSIDARDVTERFTDLALRLQMRRAYLKNLEKLLARTEDVKQMLAIQQEIAKTIEEIEVLQANVNSLTSRIAFSTIAVRLVRAHQQEGIRTRLPFYWIQTLGLEYLLQEY